jgi:hypothetical protein
MIPEIIKTISKLNDIAAVKRPVPLNFEVMLIPNLSTVFTGLMSFVTYLKI